MEKIKLDKNVHQFAVKVLSILERLEGLGIAKSLVTYDMDLFCDGNSSYNGTILNYFYFYCRRRIFYLSPVKSSKSNFV